MNPVAPVMQILMGGRGLIPGGRGAEGDGCRVSIGFSN
jgi:hypothetical protein